MGPKVECIITGCTLRIAEITWNGDLFQLGDMYCFNANPASEQHDEDGSTPFYSKCVTLETESHHNDFERRSVFVFAKADATLNEEAKAYIAKAPGAPS